MTVDEALGEAARQWTAGDRASARQLAQQLLRSAPDHPGALNLVGCAAYEEGNAGVALALFEKASRLAPQDLSIQGNLARSELAVGRIEPARRRAAWLACASPGGRALCDDFTIQLLAAARPPAIAGTFYESDPQRLAGEVDGWLQGTVWPASLARQPKVLIVPHAGHVYSGRTAGLAYARLKPFAGRISRVVMLGPAHRVYVRGVALPAGGAYQTPFGAVPLDTLGADALADLPFVSVRADVHAPEHCLEVHLPFLQRALGPFEFLPLVVGDVPAAQVATVLERLWGDERILLVISTDLSHYHPYDEAKQIDARTCGQIMALDGALSHEQACGATPLNALLGLARARELRIEQIEHCNSGDTAGDRERVVGYASFALYEPTHDARAVRELDPAQGQALVQLARSALHDAVGAARQPRPGLGSFHAHGATFVTLTQQGQLRGCIGSLQAHRPLAEDVQANAAAAALHDHRFKPVSAAEAPDLAVEVSVLSEPVPMAFASESHALWQLRPNVDGLIFECEHAGRAWRSTYLPQVWEQLPDPRAFMASLKVKAGLPHDFWSPQVRLSRYQVQKFTEAA